MVGGASWGGEGDGDGEERGLVSVSVSVSSSLSSSSSSAAESWKLCLPGADLRRGGGFLVLEVLVVGRGGLNAGRRRLETGLVGGGIVVEVCWRLDERVFWMSRMWCT